MSSTSKLQYINETRPENPCLKEKCRSLLSECKAQRTRIKTEVYLRTNLTNKLQKVFRQFVLNKNNGKYCEKCVFSSCKTCLSSLLNFNAYNFEWEENPNAQLCKFCKHKICASCQFKFEKLDENNFAIFVCEEEDIL